MIPILIPSRGRAKDIRTLQQMPRDLWEQTIMFVPKDEVDAYVGAVHGMGVIVKGLSYSSIGEKRQKMAKWAQDYFCDMFFMVDDDVIWSRRNNDHETGLVPMGSGDFQPMLNFAYSQMVGKVAVVGISAREGNNRMGFGGPKDLIEPNTRVFRAAMFRTEEFLAVEHNRLEFMEDFDVMLQLLEKGYENRCLYYWAQDQRGTQSQGGCSTTRTHESHERSAHRLQELHPNVVTLRQKTNKTGGSFGTRTEVTIAWKKAVRLHSRSDEISEASE